MLNRISINFIKISALAIILGIVYLTIFSCSWSPGKEKINPIDPTVIIVPNASNLTIGQSI
ncbi:MAG: hypothetical protein LBV55_00945, partial [Acholeplasmatales bacterium]|nr:hypothetical protein [Acholeplasmatales bacterium]